MHWIAYVFLRLLVALFWLVPFRVLYVISDGFAFLLYRVAGYRKKVIFDNLSRAFPEKSEEEMKKLVWLSYQNLTDVMLETFKLFTMPVEKIRKRCPMMDPEILNRHLDEGRSVMLTGSHYNNWEMSGIIMAGYFHKPTIMIYKPLSNPYADRFMNANRGRGGSILVPMNDAFAVMRKRAQEPSVYLFLSDQSPSSRKSAQWVNFLGIETAYVPGLDVLARKFGHTVVHYDILRIKRGQYEIRFTDLWLDTKTAQEGDITRVYSQHLEKVIQNYPPSWLWSHKRWKIKREA